MNRADQIIAEIERLKAKYRPSLWSDTDKSDEAGHKIEVLNELMLSIPEEQPSEDLEQAATSYSACGYSPFDEPYEKIKEFELAKASFIEGAKWQKEQMLKDAIHCEWKGGTCRVNGEEQPFEGGHAKIIFVKED